MSDNKKSDARASQAEREKLLRESPDSELEETEKEIAAEISRRRAIRNEARMAEIVADCPRCGRAFSRREFEDPGFKYCPSCGGRGALKREVARTG